MNRRYVMPSTAPTMGAEMAGKRAGIISGLIMLLCAVFALSLGARPAWAGADPVARGLAASAANNIAPYPKSAPSSIFSGRVQSALQTSAPALNGAPTVTMSTTACSGTTFAAASSGVVNTTNFTLSGGANYVVPSTTFPYTVVAALQQMPNSTLGFGSAFVDFVSDDPALCFTHVRSNGGVTRVFADGTEAFRVETGIRSSTVGTGSTTTSIVLDASASATNGIYVNNWIHITSGTAAGQYGLITAYVGSTKTATIQAAISAAPASGDSYDITESKAPWSNLTNTGSGSYYVTVAWGGERRMRHYRVEHSGQGFYGVIASSAVSTVAPFPLSAGPALVFGGDSFAAGTGAGMVELGSLSRVAATLLGRQLINLSIGGSGDLNPGTSFTLPNRWFPPANSWFLQLNNSTAGSFTLTQNGISVTSAFNDSQATLQASFDAAFGSGAFSVIIGAAATQRNVWIEGNGATGAVTAPMTANFSGLTATAPTITQWKGDLYLQLPKAGDGVTPLPFDVVLANCHNDTLSSSASFTATLLQSTEATLFNNLLTTYPMARVMRVGCMYLPGGSLDPNVTTADNAIQAAAQAVLPKINGRTPFFKTVTAGIFTGTGHVGAATGSGNGDLTTFTDGVHPTGNTGHPLYGGFIARQIQAIWGGI